MGKIRDWISRNKKRYTDLKDKIIRFIHNRALEIHSALSWLEIKLQTAKIMINSAIDWVIEEVGELKEVVGMLIRIYRINKIDKLEAKISKINKKIARKQI